MSKNNNQINFICPEDAKVFIGESSFDPNKNAMDIAKDDDITVLFGAWYLRLLIKYSINNDILANELNVIRKFVGNNGEIFTAEQYKVFSLEFYSYYKNEKCSYKPLEKIFQSIIKNHIKK